MLDGTWDAELIPGEELRPAGLLGFLNDPFGGEPLDASYYQTEQAEAALVVPFNGQEVIVVHSTGPGHGIWELRIDGEVVDEINAYSDTLRYNESVTLSAEEPGAHRLEIVNTGEADPAASGTLISVSEVTVLPPARAEGFGVILPLLGVLIGVNLFSLLLAFVLGRPLFGRLVERIDTKNGIILALTVYAVVAVWGFFLDSTIEFWFIAWMIAMVQGGSQALSRSLYAAMSPASKSGEFFGLFSIMEKFASLFGPLVFAAAGFLLGNSRWGVLSLILFFLIGIVLLLGVNVEEGKRVAREEDRRIMGGSAP
ncbi:MAG: MFS transporter [Anaerolineae bacterium]